MAKIILSEKSKKADTLILFWYTDKDEKLEFIGENDDEIKTLYSRLKKSKHFLGKYKETNFLRYYGFKNFENVILIGCGSKKDFSNEKMRQIAGALFSLQKKERVAWMAINFQKYFDKSDELFQAFTEGYILGSYSFVDYKKKEPDYFEPEGIEILSPKNLESILTKTQIIAEATNFSRRLGDEPSNILTPNEFANKTETMCKHNGIKCKVLRKKEIEKENMGLFLSVAKGSNEPPTFLILEYIGSKKKSHIALIGKGITFDSGGICLKPSMKMEEMKYDMMGAAVVIGVIQAISKLKLPINVTGYIPATENMPSGSALKPGDIIKSVSGKTVEIVNSDAEGRLILADAIEFSQKRNPEAIIDFATLTGAVLIALGTVTTAIMGNNEELIERIKASAKVTGERVWPMPLYEEYKEELKSHYADIKNTGTTKDAGCSKGALFLKHFVNNDIPWVHCDIAGSAWGRKDLSYINPNYATGSMVRLVVNLLENWKPLQK